MSTEQNDNGSSNGSKPSRKPFTMCQEAAAVIEAMSKVPLAKKKDIAQIVNAAVELRAKGKMARDRGDDLEG